MTLICVRHMRSACRKSSGHGALFASTQASGVGSVGPSEMLHPDLRSFETLPRCMSDRARVGISASKTLLVSLHSEIVAIQSCSMLLLLNMIEDVRD